MPLPPRNEQISLISFIETIEQKFNGLISEAENSIELLQERRTALISAAVTGKIDVRSFGGKA
jgi:type I restriction enzyme S subunit